MRTLLSLFVLVFASASLAQTAAQPDMTRQLQRLMGKKNSQEALGQAIVIGSLLGCTQKTAGKEATQRFYSEMQAVGKTAERYCKQGQAAEARALLLTTFEKNKDHAVVHSALNCYAQQSENVEVLGGERMAQDIAHYARWARDPALAEAELKESDICRAPVRRASTL